MPQGLKGFQAGRENPQFRHGHGGKKTGLSPTYVSWQGMMQRCRDINYHGYHHHGGRGIKVCDRWQVFENFLADMGERPEGKTLDRWPDNDGDYEPGNCRWATPKEQSANRRASLVVEAFGEQRPLAEWCHMLGRNVRRVRQRIQRDGWDVERALQTMTGGRH